MLDRIMRAQANYARCIDNGELERWPEFFTDDCMYVITSAENHAAGLPGGLIWADSKGMLRDRVSALRNANVYERQTYRHIVGLPVIDGENGGEVRTETPFMVVRTMREGKMDLFAVGRYLDRWLVDGQRALLRERLVICDSQRIDTLLALPL